jgi:hypothetical protein
VGGGLIHKDDDMLRTTALLLVTLISCLGAEVVFPSRFGFWASAVIEASCSGQRPDGAVGQSGCGHQGPGSKTR